jgi:gluconokinase
MVIIVMGVSGAGKSTVGAMLAENLGWPFHDGDDFHPPANVQKMRAGQPLNDTDRTPWLAAIRRHIATVNAAGRHAVIACSALKAAYRTVLRGGDGPAVQFVHLHGSPDLIQERLRARAGHFMPSALLGSQFATLEPPPDAVAADIAQTPEQIVAQVIGRLGLQKSSG